MSNTELNKIGADMADMLNRLDEFETTLRDYEMWELAAMRDAVTKEIHRRKTALRRGLREKNAKSVLGK